MSAKKKQTKAKLSKAKHSKKTKAKAAKKGKSVDSPSPLRKAETNQVSVKGNHAESTKKKDFLDLRLQDLKVLCDVWEIIEESGTPLGREKIKQAMDDRIKLGIPCVAKFDPRVIKRLKNLSLNVVDHQDGSKTYAANGKAGAIVSKIREFLDFADPLGRYSREGGQIRVGVGHSVSMSLAPRIAQELRGEVHDDVSVSFVVSDSSPLLAQWREGRLDFVLTVFHPSEICDLEPEMQYTLIPALIARHGHPVAVAYRDHLKASKGVPISFESLLGSSSTMNSLASSNQNSSDSSGGQHVVYVFEKAAIANPRTILKVKKDCVRYVPLPNYASINELVASSGGLGVTLPQMLTEYQHQRLQTIPIQIEPDHRPVLALIGRSNRTDIEQIEQFVPGFKSKLSIFRTVAKKCIMEVTADDQVHHTKDQGRRCYVQLVTDNRLQWYYGSYRVYAKNSNRFAGELTVEGVESSENWRQIPQEGHKRMQVRGREETVKGRRFRSVLSAYILEGNELFVGTICDFQRGFSVGMWVGREDKSPAAGGIVISEDNQDLVPKSMIEGLMEEWWREGVVPTLGFITPSK